MKTLIVYYSFTHNNELLAKNLESRLGCDVLKIETLRKRNSFSILFDLLFKRRPAIQKHSLTLTDYDQFVFIAPIWGGTIAAPMKTFLSEEKIHINRYSFISVCGGLAGQLENIEEQLKQILGKNPVSVVELWVSEIIKASTKDAKIVSRYRIAPDELAQFETKIKDFCFAIRSEKVLTS